MEQGVVIAVSDFSTYPTGRNEKDGVYNGTRFRKSVLAPAIKAALDTGVPVVVSLANVMSFGSSFLEEAFGGLIRTEHFRKSDVVKVLKIDAGAVENERYKDAIFRYIERA